MTRVLFYCHTGHVSGAERVLLTILHGLDRRAFNPRLAAPQGELHNPRAVPGTETRVVRALNARFTWRPDRFLRYAVSFAQVIADLRREIKIFSPQIIHAGAIRSGIAASLACWGTDRRVLWNLCDILPPRHPFNTAIRLLAILHGRCHMLAASEAVARNFRGTILKFFPRRVPIQVIHNGVDADRFSPDPAKRTRVRAHLGITADTCLFGIVGQIAPRKGHLGLLRAFATVVGQRPDSVLLVIGAALFDHDVEYSALLEDETRRLGIADRVRFIGPRSDIDAVLQALDVLVLNSVHEPFSLVLLEALAAGTPVVASNVDGVPELITDGVTGLLVPPGNDRRLAECLVSIAAQPALRQALSEHGRKSVVEHFSSLIFRAKVDALYGTLIPVPERATAEPVKELRAH
jgi:glycosyltransferase involved in cell wall biosynthesis